MSESAARRLVIQRWIISLSEDRAGPMGKHTVWKSETSLWTQSLVRLPTEPALFAFCAIAHVADPLIKSVSRLNPISIFSISKTMKWLQAIVCVCMCMHVCCLVCVCVCVNMSSPPNVGWQYEILLLDPRTHQKLWTAHNLQHNATSCK